MPECVSLFSVVYEAVAEQGRVGVTHTVGQVAQEHLQGGMFPPLLYDKDRYFDRMSNVLNGLAIDDVAQATMAVGGHHDEIWFFRFGKTDDLVGRRVRVSYKVFTANRLF